MKVYKINDGDCLQLTPIIFNNQKVNYLDLYGLYMNNGLQVMGPNNDVLIRRLIEVVNQIQVRSSPKVQRFKKYILGVLIKDEPQIIVVGQTLFNLVKGIDDITKVQLNVRIDQVKAGGQIYPDYKGGSIDLIDPNDKIHPLVSVDTYFKNRDVLSNQQKIFDYFGTDLVGKIISVIRDKKLDVLLGEEESEKLKGIWTI